jgi:hypothetical protein
MGKILLIAMQHGGESKAMHAHKLQQLLVP